MQMPWRSFHLNFCIFCISSLAGRQANERIILPVKLNSGKKGRALEQVVRASSSQHTSQYTSLNPFHSPRYTLIPLSNAIMHYEMRARDFQTPFAPRGKDL